jgi:predicted CxxxxCH...CXXCH cytochrome family protein
MNATATFGMTIGCTSCHPDWQTVPNYGHMSGSVNLVNMTGLTYGGTVGIPYGAPFGGCTTTTCHANGKGVAAPSPTWGVVSADCTICHGAPPSTGNDGARHTKHDVSAWVPNACGNCHAAPNNKVSMGGYATHVNGSVNMGGTSTVAYLGAGDCTNACHDVVPLSAGDWLDAATLACVDCHAAGFIGTDPTSGLHKTTNAMPHDVQFKVSPVEVLPGTATCTNCHTAAGPSTTHLTGPNGAAPQTSLQTTYSFNNAFVISYAQATGCQANCHTDYKLSDAGGLWRRRWVGVTDAVPGTAGNDTAGQAVCQNCHGDFSGWRWDEANASTTDHTDPYAGNTGNALGVDPSHIDCQTCHGWGHASYNKTWGLAVGHGDGSITMNGPQPTTGAGYIDSGTNQGGCAKACHAATFVMNTNSGWNANYGDFGGGACEGCHNGVTPGRNGAGDWAPNVMGPGTNSTGTGSTPKPYDDGTWGFNVSGHGANGTATTKIDTDDRSTVTTYLVPNAACTDCHALQSHHFDGVLDGQSGTAQTKKANTYHLKTDGTYPFIPASAPSGYEVQLAFDNACFNRCHMAAKGVGFDMRHLGAAEIPYGVSKFGGGTSGSIVDGDTLSWPVDSDLSTLSSTANPDYLPCATCHNVHGTNVVRTGYSSNRMLRMTNTPSSPFCMTCHP